MRLAVSSAAQQVGKSGLDFHFFALAFKRNRFVIKASSANPATEWCRLSKDSASSEALRKWFKPEF
jgi:hypothetical protein